MSRDELDVLVGWAAGEGWNPGLEDAAVYWATDPEAFVAAELDGELVGGGAIVAYPGAYGFMGLFIMRPDHRGHGLGDQLWHARRERLLQRLGDGATIEMDGVYEMQPYYARGGFVTQHRDLRFEGRGGDRLAGPHPGLVELTQLPFDEVLAYDTAHFPAPRPVFLERWLALDGAHAVGVHQHGHLTGMAVSRPCTVGHRIGPLFADEPAVAEALVDELSARLVGEPVFVDVPEVNPAALDLVRRRGMVEVFGCARMTLGPVRPMPWREIYGVTTLELG